MAQNQKDMSGAFEPPYLHLQWIWENMNIIRTCYTLAKHNIIQLHGLCSILYLACDMGLHYLISMRRNLINKKKLTPL